jgi:hypothetical protein
MDPRDRLRPLPDGVGCTVCGVLVPPDRIRILAHRDDLAFVELACPGCSSATLGLLLSPPEAGGEPFLDVAPAGRTHADGGPRGDGGPISVLDVHAMRDLLAGWNGDLRTLLEQPRDEPPPAGPAR